jgi:phosphate acetyltransferase
MLMDAAVFPRLDDLENAAMRLEPLKVAVAYPCSQDSLAAVCDASSRGMIEPILVGPRARIESCATSIGADLSNMMLVDAPDDPTLSSHAAVALVSKGEAMALMKGSQHTDELLSAVVSRDADLRTNRRMSHCFWFDLPAYHKPLMVTDAVVNIAPGLKEKVDILANAIGLAHCLGVERPKIALLSSAETINVNIPSSMDAATLSRMADRGQITGAMVDGPLAFDNAISSKSAIIKGILSDVAGDPDILVVPSLDVGNVLYKSFVYIGRGECAGLVLGAKVPIILTSRSDSRRARVASCALARLIVFNARKA